MEDKDFKIEADIRFEEIHRQNKFQTYSLKLNIILYIICFLILAGNIVLDALRGKDYLITIIFIVLLVLFQPLSTYIGSKRIYKRTMEIKSYAISETGVICQIAETQPSKRYKWIDFRKVLESEEAFLFFPNDIEYSYFFMIPKRCFADEGEIQALRELLERNVKRYRVKMNTTS